MVQERIGTKTPTEKAHEPFMGTELIPKERYTSKEFMELEWERMWTKVWNMAGRESDIPSVGDYFTTELGPESLLIVREAEDKVRAFYNVCPHRGNQIRNPGMGHAESFQCAYHFFEFNLDGSKKFVPDEDTFTQGVPQETALVEMPCDVWGGFIWFNMNPDAEPLLEFLDPVAQHLDAYHFEEFSIVADKTIEWNTNWKASVDAFNEVYHVQGIHPQLLEGLDDIHVQIDLYERHNRYLVPMGIVSPRYQNPEEVTDGLKGRLRNAGVDPAEFEGRGGEVRPFLQKRAREVAEEQGMDVSELNDDQMSDDYHYYIFPQPDLQHAPLGLRVLPPAAARDRPEQDVLRHPELRPPAGGDRGSASDPHAAQARRYLAGAGDGPGLVQPAARAEGDEFAGLQGPAHQLPRAAHPPHEQGHRRLPVRPRPLGGGWTGETTTTGSGDGTHAVAAF